MVLFMLGALGLLIINANKLSKHFKENIGFQVYLKDTATSVQTDALIQELSNSKFTKQVLFISKEKAAQKLKTDLGKILSLFRQQSIIKFNRIKNRRTVCQHRHFINY